MKSSASFTMESLRGCGGAERKLGRDEQGINGFFKMPLHYPKYSKAEYETMPEWEIDRLLSEYGLPSLGSVEQKRKFAMEAFLWPHSSTNL